MKVAYNACFGGFCLSSLACEILTELKGKPVRAYNFCDKRHDTDLIKVIEDLGDDASGPHSELKIIEIPDGSIYEIYDYDGSESVIPPRQGW